MRGVVTGVHTRAQESALRHPHARHIQINRPLFIFTTRLRKTIIHHYAIIFYRIFHDYRVPLDCHVRDESTFLPNTMLHKPGW